jgi:hypothetical protein
MLFIVAISIFDDDGTELDEAKASGETLDEAFERARTQLDVQP